MVIKKIILNLKKKGEKRVNFNVLEIINIKYCHSIAAEITDQPTHLLPRPFCFLRILPLTPPPPDRTAIINSIFSYPLHPIKTRHELISTERYLCPMYWNSTQLIFSLQNNSFFPPLSQKHCRSRTDSVGMQTGPFGSVWSQNRAEPPNHN